jgi:hypothetical protein
MQIVEDAFEPTERPEVSEFEVNEGVKFIGETIPSSQDDEEFSILLKFIASLQHFEDRDISGSWRRGNAEFPDFEKGGGDDLFGIELTEIRHVRHDALRRLQHDYRDALIKLIKPIYSRLSGLEIILDDRYQDPPYPRVRSAAGREVADAIAAHVVSFVDQLEDLPFHPDGFPHGLVLHTAKATPGGVHISFLAHRFAPKDAGRDPVIRYAGTFPESVDALSLFLANAVEHKVNKRYGVYPGSLWLLVYGRDAWFTGPPPSEAGANARSLLSTMSHPFDEVWFIFPYAGIDVGSIEQVWP